MAKKVRWILLGILILIFGGLFLTRNLWQPWFFGFIFPRQQKLEGLKLIADLMVVIAAVVSLVYGVLKFFFARPELKPVEYPKILTLTTPAKILRDYVAAKAGEITWLDRQIVTTTDLRTCQKILLVGRMKSGKTHEAAELIRRALGEGLIIPSRIYDITQSVRGYTLEILQSALQREVDPGSRVLFFINDLPKQASGKQLEVLTEHLKVLERCSPGYFIATARSDQLDSNPELKKWLAEKDVKLIEMKPISEEQGEVLIDELARNRGDRKSVV